MKKIFIKGWVDKFKEQADALRHGKMHHVAANSSSPTA